MDNSVQDIIQKEMLRQADVIEEAAEKSLLTGDRGVMVIRQGPLLISAEPHPGVPYGHIYIFEGDD